MERAPATLKKPFRWAVSRQVWHVTVALGLEAKILILVMGVLCSSVTATCWVWSQRVQMRMESMLEEQVRQTAYSVSHASEPAMESENTSVLHLIGRDMLDGRSILYVAFYDANKNNISTTHRDPNFRLKGSGLETIDPRGLMQIRREDSDAFGRVLRISAPVMGLAMNGDPPTLLGYVTVGLSTVQEQLEIRWVNSVAAGIAGVMVLISFPMSYMLVHLILRPIRALGVATRRIEAGDLDTQVAVDRPDAIGRLARSFNQMVQTVKMQRLALQNANRDLEGKVKQRTAQLEIANKRLSVEIAEKEDFLRAISHDLNAPLRNISGMASMLLLKNREKFDEDVIHRLERIQKNVEVETDLISELLELSRIKTRRQRMEMVEIRALVRDLGDMFENDLREHGIKLVIDTDLPVLHGEKARFRQVFQNLIDNAIKYMGEGPVREIHVGCGVRGTEAEFYVRDTGLGIEAEDQDKVFFIFRRGRNTHNLKVLGKGVGLASVKSIIETYNGTIWVESDLGKGSTFKFTINGQYVPSASSASSASTVKVGAPILNVRSSEHV